jgi:hypothetical protein
VANIVEVLHALAGARVQDVQTLGWLDRDEVPPRFVPYSHVLHLELDEGFLRLEEVGSHGGLALSVVPEIMPKPEEILEDEEIVAGSLGGFFLFDRIPQPITRIRYWTNGESDLERAIVRCAEFRLGAHLDLFADPMWMPGIRLGAHGFDWDADATAEHERLFGRLTEHVWKP